MLNVECMSPPVKFISSGGRGDFWSKNVFLILACDDTIYKKKGVHFCTLGSLFPRLLKRTVLDQPPVDNGGVSSGRSVAVAVGYWLLALQWPFNGTSMALQWHFNITSTKKRKIRKKHCFWCFHPHRLRECLRYARFSLTQLSRPGQS